MRDRVGRKAILAILPRLQPIGVQRGRFTTHQATPKPDVSHGSPPAAWRQKPTLGPAVRGQRYSSGETVCYAAEKR